MCMSSACRVIKLICCIPAFTVHVTLSTGHLVTISIAFPQIPRQPEVTGHKTRATADSQREDMKIPRHSGLAVSAGLAARN